MQRGGHIEQVAGFQRNADPSGNLLRQRIAEFRLLYFLHVAAGGGRQGNQRQADEQATQPGDQCQLMAEACVAESIAHALWLPCR